MFKFFNQKRKKGQSTLEYAILIIIVIGALVSIQMYIKRGVQGRLKQATDDIGDQFSPGNTNVVKIHHVASSSTDTFRSGVSASKLTANEDTTDSMNSTVMNNNFEFWGK